MAIMVIQPLHLSVENDIIVRGNLLFAKTRGK